MKKVVMPLFVIGVLCLIPYIGVQYAGLGYLFAVIIPCASLVVLIAGFAIRMVNWLIRPVPFRIPTTCGQEKSLDWIKQDKLESPYHFWEAIARVLGEVFLFRSLFRNTKAELYGGPKLAYGSTKWLWLAGMTFHWSLLIIVLRHSKFFFSTVPPIADFLDNADRFFDITLPAFYMTDALVLAAISFLVVRRLRDPKLRLISLPTDFFPLFLILAIALAGMSMRYVTKINVLPVHDQILTLMDYSFILSGEIGVLFYVHLFLVCVLAVYFPFSKLMHAGGIFLSPTRNLCNNSRAKRYRNPWNPDIKFKSYTEYENDYRDKMKKAALPVENE